MEANTQIGLHQLPIIREGQEEMVEEEEEIDEGTVTEAEVLSEEWKTTTNRKRLVRLRGVAKAQHTRQCNVVNHLITTGVEREPLLAERLKLTRDFERVDERHGRLMTAHFTPYPSELYEKERVWFNLVSSDFKGAMGNSDQYLSLLPTHPAIGVTRSRGSAAPSSSTRSKLLESERKVAEAELKMKQQREEARIQERKKAVC
jgi:hypothetical protein